MRLTEQQRDAATAEEAGWLASYEAGTPIAEIAAQTGWSPVWVRERIRRAKATRRCLMESGSNTSAEIPRLELCDYPNPLECCHSRRSTSSDGRIKSCMRCDALSTDGGVTWLDAQSHKTPNIAVLAPHGTGRGERLQRLGAGSVDPKRATGPTTYAPDLSLAGGKGSRGQPSGSHSSSESR